MEARAQRVPVAPGLVTSALWAIFLKNSLAAGAAAVVKPAPAEAMTFVMTSKLIW